MKRVIITGPTGAIGMALIEYLSERNIEIIAVLRNDSKREKQIVESENIVKVNCSLAEIKELPQRVQEAVKRKNWDLEQLVDTFYHFAWDGTVGDHRNNMYLQNLNVQYALDAVDVAARLGCKVFIGAGSQAEYGRYMGKLNAEVPVFPENGYGMSKLCAGQMTRIYCEQKGLKHIWVRILSVYGPYDGTNTMIMCMINKMLRRERVSCTKAEQIWDYLYSKDAAKAMYLLGDRGVGGKIYCLGNGASRPLKEYIEVIRSIVNPEAEIGYGDIEYAPKQVMYLCADIRELVRDTGYSSTYTFEMGIKETVKMIQEGER